MPREAATAAEPLGDPPLGRGGLFDYTFLSIVFVPVAAAGSPLASAAFSFCPKVFSGKYPAKTQFSWLTYGGCFSEK